METISGDGIGGNIHLSVSLCGIVGIAGVVKEAEPCINADACLQAQFSFAELPSSEGIVPAVLEIVETAKFIVVVFPIMDRQQLGLVYQLTGQPAAVLTYRVGDIPQLRATVFFWREVSVEYVYGADTEHLHIGYHLVAAQGVLCNGRYRQQQTESGQQGGFQVHGLMFWNRKRVSKAGTHRLCAPAYVSHTLQGMSLCVRQEIEIIKPLVKFALHLVINDHATLNKAYTDLFLWRIEAAERQVASESEADGYFVRLAAIG